jgi:glycosyltransferase involved in cell wall biosynthesis
MRGGLTPDISVVIPLHDEVENVDELHAQLTRTLEGMGRPYEILMVDDGSTDGTTARLLQIEAADPRVRVLRLRRNFGQTAAFSAGFDHARGAIVVTCDGDLQNDPGDIPAMVAKLESGFDMVCGWRRERKDSFSRTLPSRIANWVISRATSVHLHDYGCSLKVMRGEVVKGLRLYGEMHRFIPAVASWMGVELAEMPVNHRPRTRGRSKYGLGRTTRVLLDLFTVKFMLAYGTRPAHFFGPAGLLSTAAGLAIMAYLTFIKLVEGEAIGGRPLLVLGALLFITGLVFVSVGLLAELMVRVYHESQGKPTYAVRELRPGTAAPTEPDSEDERQPRRARR